ncbi:disks large homolog 5-like isoform X1 [Peromyscus eremicus]|uniref:disks large homolog 5-like isoform X1 n=2 Tax=Peromyscus eremicus TaxID=42410 RepID=UPI0027DBF30C|nr:disks large homolog 5-like isoform X1 [Peromyscus eremicus]
MNMLGRLRTLLGREKGEGRETRERQTQAGLQPFQCEQSRKKWSRRWYRASKEPPPTPTSLTKKQVKQKVESLTTQLREMTAQRNDLRDRLILVTEGSLDNKPYHRPNPFWEKLKMEHQQVMSHLQKFEKENLEVSQKLSELTKEKDFLCDLQSRLLMEQSQLKKKLDMLRQQKENLLEDCVVLKHHLGDLQVLSKDQEEISDLQNQQQQEQQRMEERLQSLLKQRELVTQQKHLTIKLQHHLTVSQMRSENLQQELEQSTAQDESLLPTELLLQEH